MDVHYDAPRVEKKWQKKWEKERIYTFVGKGSAPLFTLDTPPPTLSGNMHVGHAFSYAQGDYIARYHRMNGEKVLYPFGTDDNGLPTERLVEKVKNVHSLDMSRKEFIDLCMKTIQEIKPGFVQAWKDLGISCDFSSSYSTLDTTSRKTSQLSFLELYSKGRIYSENSPVAWCTTCQTAIAQAEFENKELQSAFHDIIFMAGNKEVIISTTRPELLPACVALFYHPDDERYHALRGKFATVPLFGYDVPILSDQRVDMEKGTGIVMCCTFGDKTDIEWWHAYHLPLRELVKKDGTFTQHAQRYAGLTLREAYKRIVHDLEHGSFLKKQQPITHPVNLHERCKTKIEFIKTQQWYIKLLDKKQELIDAADSITWRPDFMKKRYVHWVENLQWDWCISRQRHFGIPFPLWKCDQCGDVLLARAQQLPVDPLTTPPPRKLCECGGTYVGEPDVMDTWATSSLTPHIVLGWARNKKLFMTMFPMTLRIQAHDIIRTWTFYTIVKAVFTHGTLPWKNIMISGFVTFEGEKMSKSKGNVVDPLVVMRTYGADALRFWAAGGTLGADIPYMEKDVVTGKKMVTKLWNAGRFVLPHLKDYDGKRPKKLEIIDASLLSALQHLIKRCRNSFSAYDYHAVRSLLEQFFWHDFCDNYLETVKDRLYHPDTRGKDARISAQYTLFTAFSTLLKLLAPLMPHITEEIYFSLFRSFEKIKSIHLCSYPEYEPALVDARAEDLGKRFFDIVAMVRKEKTTQGRSLSSEIILSLDTPTQRLLHDCFPDLRAVCKARGIQEGTFKVEF